MCCFLSYFCFFEYVCGVVPHLYLNVFVVVVAAWDYFTDWLLFSLLYTSKFYWLNYLFKFTTKYYITFRYIHILILHNYLYILSTLLKIICPSLKRIITKSNHQKVIDVTLYIRKWNKLTAYTLVLLSYGSIANVVMTIITYKIKWIRN